VKRIVFVAGSLALVGSPLPPDEEPPFKTSWVFSRECQNALCDILFGRIVPNREWMSKLSMRSFAAGGPLRKKPTRRTSRRSQQLGPQPRRRVPSVSCPVAKEVFKRIFPRGMSRRPTQRAKGR
jgi:hypothetical protein